MKISVYEEVMKREPKCGSIRFIAIDGRAGSGKSTCAEIIGKALNAEIIHTDDFANWENPINWWPRLIDEVFIPIQNGVKQISYERSNWWKDQKRSEIINQEVTPIMIIEGVSAFRNEFRQYITYSICLKAPREIRIDRGIRRDLSLGVSEKADKISKYWDEWDIEENLYFERDKTEQESDLILDGTIPIEEQISLA